MSAHTPGPLRVLQNAKNDQKATRFLVVTDYGDRPVAIAEFARADDADLFAAAPRLAEALLSALAAGNEGNEPNWGDMAAALREAGVMP